MMKYIKMLNCNLEGIKVFATPFVVNVIDEDTHEEDYEDGYFGR